MERNDDAFGMGGSDRIAKAEWQRLKAPAKFKGMFDSPLRDVRDEGLGRYTVRSWVEAENAFGVPLRTPFLCEVNFDRDEISVVFL